MPVVHPTIARTQSTPRDRRAMRWLQFRLGTLLFVPVVLVLLQRLANNYLGSLMLLYLAYGAIFGSLWGVGRMRIVGLKQSGHARLTPVLWAALCGGATAGILAGPLGIWIGLFRESTWWLYQFDPMRGTSVLEFRHLAYELISSGLYGSLAGALFGAWGALIAGPAWAYLAFARQWSRGEDQSPAATVDHPQRSRLRILVIAFYGVALLGLPAIVLWNGRFAWRDQQTAARCASGWQATRTGWDSVEPNWSGAELPLPRSPFARLVSVSFTGPITPAALDSIADCQRLASIHFSLEPTNEELRQLAERLQSLQGPTAPRITIWLEGRRFSATGIRQLAAGCACGVDLADAEWGKAIFAELAANTGGTMPGPKQSTWNGQVFTSWRYGWATLNFQQPYVPPIVVIPSYLPLWGP